MRGINIVILIALIAFAIGIVSLAWEYFQTLSLEPSIQNFPEQIQSNYFENNHLF